MQCLKCGKDGVFTVNASDVGESGVCTIACTFCGQEHTTNLTRRPPQISLSPTWKQTIMITIVIVAVFAVMYGIHQLVLRLLS